jgi:hypothetical protein
MVFIYEWRDISKVAFFFLNAINDEFMLFGMEFVVFNVALTRKWL